MTDSASVTFAGLQAWLATIGRDSYRVRVDRNTDTIQSFTDVDIVSGGSVVDVIKFPDKVRDFPRSGMRAKNDSGGLKADRITINPQPMKWGKTRATISAVQIMANPGAEAPAASPSSPVTSVFSDAPSVNWEHSFNMHIPLQSR